MSGFDGLNCDVNWFLRDLLVGGDSHRLPTAPPTSSHRTPAAPAAARGGRRRRRSPRRGGRRPGRGRRRGRRRRGRRGGAVPWCGRSANPETRLRARGYFVATPPAAQCDAPRRGNCRRCTPPVSGPRLPEASPPRPTTLEQPGQLRLEVQAVVLRRPHNPEGHCPSVFSLHAAGEQARQTQLRVSLELPLPVFAPRSVP
jgi:hypothetical protein